MNNIQTTSATEEAVIVSDASRSVLLRHLRSFQDNNLEGIMSDYTDESVLVTQDAVFKGPDEIKAFFTGLIAEFPKQNSSFELDKVTVNGELVYIVWHGKTPSLNIPFATDTFIIRDGKISQQTFAGQLESTT